LPSIVLGDIAEGVSPIGIDVTVPSVVCLSVCHIRALCSNSRRYRHFFCIFDSPTSLPDRKFGLHRSNQNPVPKFAQSGKVTHLLLIWASESRRHSTANCGRMVRAIMGNHYCSF